MIFSELRSNKNKSPDGNLKPSGLFIVSSAKKKPPVLPGEIKSFSKNKNG